MLRSLPVAAAVLGASIVAANAGGNCATCYQKVVHPPVYRTVAEQVMVRPPQTVAHTTPAEFGVVHEKVMIRPAQTVARHVPPVMGTVAETVMVAPARKEWQLQRDAHGREVGCWVKIPAQYATQHKTVVIHPGHTVHEVIPAQYGVQARKVMVRPAQVHHQVIPATYATRHRTEMVAPASASWQPTGGHRGHHKHY